MTDAFSQSLKNLNFLRLCMDTQEKGELKTLMEVVATLNSLSVLCLVLEQSAVYSTLR